MKRAVWAMATALALAAGATAQPTTAPARAEGPAAEAAAVAQKAMVRLAELKASQPAVEDVKAVAGAALTRLKQIGGELQQQRRRLLDEKPAKKSTLKAKH
ncbi:unnamed protein product, partial [marine sediment metagenome]